jgi:hypothetical protein
MIVNWGPLLVVAVVSAAAALVVVLLVAFSIVGLSARARQPMSGAVLQRAAGLSVAVVCLSAALMIVLFGLSVITS